MSRWKKGLLIVLAVCVLGFGALEGIILAGGHDEVNHEPAVMIVLGCLVRPDGPSKALVSRMDTALAYYKLHPEVTIIVSGGKGAPEPVSEADAMSDYLIAHGVPAVQIWCEDASTSTQENLLYSMELMRSHGLEPDTTPVIVVSNGFHLTRVRLLCQRYGLEADTLSAPMPTLPSAVKSNIREVFALIKSFIID